MKYDLKHKPDINIHDLTKLFSIVWDTQNPDRIKAKTMWAFGNTFSKVLVYEDSGMLIAARGGIHWPLTFPTRDIKAIQFHGTCVHPAYRRQGIFSSINKDFLKEAEAENIDVIFNVSVDNSRAGYEKLGWKYCKGFRRLTYFNNPLSQLLNLDVNSSRKKADFTEHIKEAFISARNAEFQNKIFCKYDNVFLDWRLSNKYEDYQILQTDDAALIYKKVINNGKKEIIIGECFLMEYKFKAFSHIINELLKIEGPSMVYTYIATGHPCYSYYLKKFFFPNPKRLNLNFGVKVINTQLQSEIENTKWGISFLDIDTF